MGEEWFLDGQVSLEFFLRVLELVMIGEIVISKALKVSFSLVFSPKQGSNLARICTAAIACPVAPAACLRSVSQRAAKSHQG